MDDDIPDTLAGAAPLMTGINRARLDGPDDRDLWRFEIQEGLYYQIDPLGDGTPGSVEELTVALLDESGAIIRTSDRVFIDDTLFFNAETDGLRYIDVPSSNTDPIQGSYVLDFNDTDTVGSTRNTSSPIVIGESTMLDLTQPEDIDAYSIDAEPGITYLLTAEFTDASISGTPDVTLFDTRDEVIPTSGSTAFPDEVATGVSFVGTFDNEIVASITRARGEFRLFINGEDTVTSNVLTTESLSIAEPVRGRLEVAGDDDWYQLDLPAGERVLIRADSGPSIVSADTARLDIYDSIGRPLPAGSFERVDQDVIIYQSSDSDPVFLEAGAQGGRIATESLDFQLLAEPIGGRSIGDGLSVADALDVAFLYEAGLDRDQRIDRAGLNFWIDAREDGLAYRAIADAFLLSEEFTAASGALDTLSDRALVEALYENVLDREGEAAGTDFWTAVLGQDGFSRADLLIAFAESEENREEAVRVRSLEEIVPGFWDFTA